MLRILHLSDPHFRPGDPDDRDSAGRALLATLADQQAAGVAPELVLVSGDLIEQGDAQAYPVVGRFFDLLRATLGDLPRERVVVVPGNHDVDRERGRRLQRTLASPEDAEVFFSTLEERELHQRKLAAYVAFIDGYFGAGAAQAPSRSLRLGGISVGVAALWSTWFCQGDDDREQLWVGAGVVSAAARELAACELTVALSHHGPEWLHPQDRAGVLAALRQGFDLVCHGHLHAHRPPDQGGTPLAGRPVLAAGCLHRRAQHPSRAFLIDVEEGVLKVTPLHHRRGADRWEPEDSLGDLYGTTADPRPFPLPQRSAAAPTQRRQAQAPRSPQQRDEEALRRYLSGLVQEADEHAAAFRHPGKDQPLRLPDLYIELPVRQGEGGEAGEDAPAAPSLVGAHALLAHKRVVLTGPPGAGKTATARHLCGQLARRALGMPSALEDPDRSAAPLPIFFALDRLPPPPSGRGRAGGRKEVDLLAALEAQVAARSPDREAHFAERCLLSREVVVLADGLDEVPEPARAALLEGLLQLLGKAASARLLLTLRPATQQALQGPLGALRPRPIAAQLLPLRHQERQQLIDRFMQAVSDIPVGMTLFGTAADLTASVRRAATTLGSALGESPLLLSATCWLAARYGLPAQRAELFAQVLGALVENHVRPTTEQVADLVDELAQSCEPLQSFRVAQSLAERTDPWSAVRPLLDDPGSYDALGFLAGLRARAAPEAGSQLLRALLSEAGGRLEPAERAQLVGLASRLLGEMAPYSPDGKLRARVQEEMERILTDLGDRIQRTPLPVRIAIAEGLGRAGDPRVPLDLLDGAPATAGRLWVEQPAGGGFAQLSMMRFPLTCAQLHHLVRLSGYDPPREPAERRPIIEIWRERAERQPNHPAVLLSWQDALWLCRFLTQADWRSRYDLPTEREWERAVRQEASGDRFYPWGSAMEPGYCNTGRRVGRTTPVGIYPAGTAAAGTGCADLVGNVWEWCQAEQEEDPTIVDLDESGQLALQAVQEPGSPVARGGSYCYLRTGIMRGHFPGGRSDEIGLRLVRRSK